MFVLAARGAQSATESAGAEDRERMSAGQWLVDRAHDIGLRAGQSRSRLDAETSLVWAAASTRLAPRLAEAYWWQYDLASRLGRHDAALKRLRIYVDLKPEDVEAHRLLIELSVARLQTVEERLTLLRRQLADADDAELERYLHYRLGELEYGRGALEEAGEHAEAALASFEWYVPAIELRQAVRDDQGGPALELRWLLGQVMSQPRDPVLLWQVAAHLSGLSMYDCAAEWYGRAHSAFAATSDESEALRAFLLDWAGNALGGGSPRTALELCQQVLDAKPYRVDAQMLALRAKEESGDEAAGEQLDELRRRSGELEEAVRGNAYKAVLERLNRLDAEPRPRADDTDVRTLLKRFDADILKFHRTPQKFVALSGRPSAMTVDYGRPIRCTWTLTNNAGFPITLGADATLDPQLLISIQREESGDVPPARVDAYLSISLTRRRVLVPDQSVSITRTLVLGPAQQLLRRHSHDRCRFVFSALLDPQVRKNGTWASRLRAFPPATVTVDRAGVDPRGEAMQRLFAKLRSSRVGERVEGVVALGGVIAEGKPDHAVLESRRRLLDTLDDPSWYVRARSLDALGGVDLDQATIRSAATCLSDSHWLVRMLVVDLFSAKQGETFLPVLERLKEGDPDVLVRRLAGLHAARFDAAADDPDRR
jgi:hypothetical protein